MNALRRIIGEAHRRSLWQVLALYVVGSWVSYEVILALTEGLGLPSWVPGFAVVLFLIGLPIVLATAFIQEGHPLQDRPADAHAAGGADAVPGMETAAAALAVDRGPDDSRDVAVETGRTTRDPAAGSTRFFTWSRAITAGVLAFAALGLAAAGFMGMRSLGIGPAATLVSAGVLDEREVLVLADFEGTDASLADLVTEALRIDLHESTVLNLADAGYVANVLRRMQRDPSEPLTAELAREVAVREGLKAVIAGEVRELGGRYVLTASVQAAGDGSTLAAFREDAAGEAELLEAVDALGSRVREKVGESLRSVRRSEPLETVSTASLPALRLYSQAERVENRTGDPARAAELFERAVAEDSTFAMAWRKLGIQLSNEGRDPERMREALTRAYELRDRLPDHERYMAEGSYHRFVAMDEDAAARAYRTLLELHPDHTPALNNLSLIYGASGRHQEALDLLARAAELNPDPLQLTNLASALAQAGQLDSADVMITETLRRSPDYQLALAAKAGLAALRGDYAATDSIGRRVAEIHPDGRGPAMSLVLRGSVGAVQGRLEEALDRLGRAVDYGLDERYYGDVAQSLASMIDILMLHRGDTTAAVALLDRTLERVPLAHMPPEIAAHAVAAGLYARAGQIRQADSLLALDRVTREAAGIDEDLGVHHTARGYLALHGGQPDSAAAAFRRSANSMGCAGCEDFRLGLAFERAEQPDSAIAAWTRAVEATPINRVILHAAWRPYMLRRLGELYDARGETTTALRYYTEFLELWSDPDPVLRPTVDAVRDRVARLTGDRPG